MEDGLITSELNESITNFDEAYPGLLTVVSYSKNQGLGYALSRGLPVCRNEIVARMDSDDYAFPTRMEEQLALMEERDLDCGVRERPGTSGGCLHASGVFG